MKPGNVLRLYRLRLRARWVQECCAVVGIAAGVALLFAAEVANHSLHGSVAELAKGVAGRATLQLRARGHEGFPEEILIQVRATDGVRRAAPLIEANANAVGPKGSASIALVGADESLAKLGGALVSHTRLSPFGQIGAVVVPAPLADALGVHRFGQEMTLQAAGRSVGVPLYAVLRRRQIGGLAQSPVAVAPLSFVQEALGLKGRVTRILVEPAPGAGDLVAARLRALSAGRLDVEPVGYEETLFGKASEANDRSTSLFAAIGALVGFLFAFNGMLLTVPQRRRLAADLRRDGYTPRTVIAVLGLDALVLGLGASVLGLALGDELSIALLHPNPAFLSLAFALGGQRVVDAQSVALAVAGGMGAALVAVMSPLRDVLSRDPLAAIAPHEKRGRRVRLEGRLSLAGLACLGLASAVLLADPRAASVGMALLVGALLAQLPLAIALTLSLVERLASLRHGVVAHLARMEIDAVRTRATAIAATGAIAVFGSVAVEGAHHDLLAGLEGVAAQTTSSSDVWVAPAGDYDLLDTTPFKASEQAKLARLKGVRRVKLYRGGLLDVGSRRVLVLAPPAGEPRGRLVISSALAEERHAHVGQTIALPTPRPVTLTVAALSTNLGWAPGAITMNAEDFAKAWGSRDVSAYGVDLELAVPPASAVAEIRRALGPGSGLAVQSAAQRQAKLDALDRKALDRLTQISTLIPLVAVLAMATAMGALVWQRRPRMAKLRLEGFAQAELWRATLLESFLLVGAGCLVGALFGVYGAQLADRALAQAVDFPVSPSLTVVPALKALALVSLAALAVLALPGYLAAKAPPALAFQD